MKTPLITIFAAKSLNGVVDELIAMYNEEQPNVEVVDKL